MYVCMNVYEDFVSSPLVYVCMYVCMYVCTVCIYYLYIYVCMYVCMYVCIVHLLKKLNVLFHFVYYKVFGKIADEFFVNDDLVATFQGIPFSTSRGPVTSTLKGKIS